MAKNHKVYILLQHFEGVFSDLYQIMENDPYNHASIGISETMHEFYSFRAKWGFCAEHPFLFDKDHKRSVPCIIYVVNVSSEAFHTIEQDINRFQKRRQYYRYSYLSLMLGFLGIKHNFLKGYFGSKFVAELLLKSGCLELAKSTSCYLPSDFRKEDIAMCFEGLASEFRLI